jgi:hypothetical protein
MVENFISEAGGFAGGFRPIQFNLIQFNSINDKYVFIILIF